MWPSVQAQQVEIAALTAAIERRKLPSGCIHSSDRGSQYIASAYCKALRRRGLVGSMGRRGDPYGRHKAQSFTSSPRRPRSMKTAFWFFSNIAIERRAGLAKAS
jgi:putative transposase